MASVAKRAKTDQTAPQKVCPYGASCYRKNPAHFVEFSHPKPSNDGGPGDTSKPDDVTKTSKRKLGTTPRASTSTDGSALPPCKYGAKCYRKNLLHFAEYSHPTVPTSAADDSGSGDTDVYDSEDEKDKDQEKTKPSSGDNILNRGMSVLKSFSKMTEEERKDLIKKAFEAKDLLAKELQATKKQVEEKEKELKKLQEEESRLDTMFEPSSKSVLYSCHFHTLVILCEVMSKLHQLMNKGLLFVDGEKEALEGDKTVYFTLLPERHYKEGSADQIHFRLAESQFYRLISGEDDQKYRVIKVQYVVTPHLVKRFKVAREKLKKTRGEDASYPVLGFHGTDENNITPICEKGFKMPGESGFVEKTDSGWYGAGIYFSEYPSYSMDYINGAERLLLCQVLPGKVFNCIEIEEGSKLQKGYDSHMSPDKKELVIFNSHYILPCYVVHYSSPTSDFTYKTAMPGMKRIRKVGGPDRHGGALSTQLNKAKKAAASRVFEGKCVHFATHNAKQTKALVELLTKHKGTQGTEAKFDVLVVSHQVDPEHNKTIETALEKDIPVVTEEFFYECIFHKEFLDPEYFLHEVYD